MKGKVEDEKQNILGRQQSRRAKYILEDDVEKKRKETEDGRRRGKTLL